MQNRCTEFCITEFILLFSKEKQHTGLKHTFQFSFSFLGDLLFGNYFSMEDAVTQTDRTLTGRMSNNS